MNNQRNRNAAMTRKEFMKEPSDFGFELDPLDVNLVAIQKQLLDTVKIKSPANGSLETISEEYVSRNPEREYGRMTIAIREGYKGAGFDVIMTVYSKDEQFLTSTVVCHGDWDLVCRFVDSYPHSGDFKWDFFSSCKANALWTDYCITNFVKRIEWEAKPQKHSTWMTFFYGRTGHVAFDAKVTDALNDLYSDAIMLLYDIPQESEVRKHMLALLMQSYVEVKVWPSMSEIANVPLGNESILLLPVSKEQHEADGQQLIVSWNHEADIEDLTDGLLPMLYQTLKMKKDMVRIESREDEFYIHGIAELEGCRCCSWGEKLLHVTDNEYGEYLVNQATGKVRKIVERRKLVGFPDDEIDFEAIDKLEHSHNAHTRDIDYADINCWANCKNGLIALSWMLYPDGRYFADEDGFGMEDNDEVTVYCVMNEDLEVIRPFAPVENVPRLLKQLSLERAKHKNNDNI